MITVFVFDRQRNKVISFAPWGGVADLSFPTSKLRRGRVQGNGQICPTLMAGEPNIYHIERRK